MRKTILAIATAVIFGTSVGAAYASTSTAPSSPYQGVVRDGPDVKPFGIQGPQEYFTLDAQQWVYARDIVAKADEMGMPPYAAVIAVATAMQESTLTDYAYATDHDSLGLFQQRPSCGWGTPSEIEDPSYAAGAFLGALSRIGYMHMTLTDAAQAVQRSAYPYAYAKYQNLAATVVVDVSRGQ